MLISYEKKLSAKNSKTEKDNAWFVSFGRWVTFSFTLQKQGANADFLELLEMD